MAEWLARQTTNHKNGKKIANFENHPVKIGPYLGNRCL